MPTPRGFDLSVAPSRDVAAEDFGPVCERVDAVYGLRARQTIRRLISDWLGQYKITPTELLHLPEHLARLEGAGSLLQGAVQRAARAQVQESKGDVQQRMRTLFSLFDQILKQVRTDARSGRMPTLEGDDLADLARRVADDPEPAYCFNAAIAARLAGIASVGEKLCQLLAWLAHAPDDTAPLLDQLISDFLDDSGALMGILGEHPDLLTALLCLIALARGDAWERADAPAGYDALRRWIGAGRMPYCRDAVLRRVAQTLRGHRPLCGGDLASEAAAQERLMDELRDADGWLRGGLSMSEAFRARAGRQLHAEAIARLLADSENALDRFEALLAIEGGIIEGPTKELYGEYLRPIIETPANRPDFLAVADEDARQHVRRLAALAARVKASRLADVDKEKLGEMLDDISVEVLVGTKLLERMVRAAGDPANGAVRLMDLCTEGETTPGRARDLVREKIKSLLRLPGFMEALTVKARNTAEGRQTLIAIGRLLESFEGAKLAV